ncbi:HNH endonuclease signature motif containing protein [Schinkia azotoformans]|uniref:HNH endonuclease signature motif containing protein n=1 Tax=Schinkia azotoformans TaxID=1454 RepID=UPI002DC05FCF|nr:HNH endonuclease signature motif containing protein [Schinkia azotoformans]MEC1717980.1 HNH endonuclease signature motif containing protein [Schinkia azotoformans]MEC1743299.1 HNH endonuclease signature motif containing protein [Schinkia azotoformans]MEC1746867.1 HNH endonuclease signature motif containing protein [Schinkia azotoformans]MEC1760360.1 HNH endonuclease signature motif containing protein [Schinkia azotoformans]MEC1769228.1 HNH endonuclease signature motif containing protein [Sc
MKNFISNRTIEYNDNRIGRFIAQYGKCAITGFELGKYDWYCHHKIPYHLSKDDNYSNLIILHETIHRLVHLKDIEKISITIESLKLSKKQIQKVNELRKLCRNDLIID